MDVTRYRIYKIDPESKHGKYSVSSLLFSTYKIAEAYALNLGYTKDEIIIEPI